MNDRVSNASTHLRNKLVNYSDKNIDKNTADTYAYFIANEQELKYLLSAYKVTNRYTIMIRHFTNVFGQVSIRRGSTFEYDMYEDQTKNDKGVLLIETDLCAMTSKIKLIN